jgi:GR25 family glycosyltransferase involved in LPS biosynthesis
MIFYINLDSREDKNLAAISQLKSTIFPFQRIRAIEYSEICEVKIPYKYFRLVSAVKKSHIKACHDFLDSNFDFALILEDDFKLPQPNFNVEIEKVCRLMKKKKLDFLQLGHLTYIESSPKNSIIDYYTRHLFENGFRFVTFLRHPFTPIVENHIRWGAQAYLINRKAGESLISLIDPDSEAPIDKELRRLSDMRKEEEFSFTVARLKKNMIKQNFVFSSDTQGVVGRLPD